MSSTTVREFHGPEAMAGFAAKLFGKALRAKKQGPLIAALSGGRTPGLFFGLLAGLDADWTRVHFFMADERLVTPGSADSNYEQARRLLFSRINIPPANLHAVNGLRPDRAAAAYERELLKLAGPSGAPDMVFLGLGEDGHTASLFPGSPALGVKNRSIIPARAPKGVKPASRITMTLKAINSAGTIVLMAAGPAKRGVFKRAAARDESIPAGRLRASGRLYLLFSDK